MNHYNINGNIFLRRLSIDLFFEIRFKDDVPISDRVLSQDRIRTYSDGILTIQQIEPNDHGSYVCVISASNSVSVRSRPAMISIKCMLNILCIGKDIRREWFVVV